MDPLSIAAAAFGTAAFGKELIAVSQSIAGIIDTTHNADKVLQTFCEKCESLGKLLARFDSQDISHAEWNDAKDYMLPLQNAVAKLKKRTAELKSSSYKNKVLFRVKLAVKDLRQLKKDLEEIEKAQRFAHMAFDFIDFERRLKSMIIQKQEAEDRHTETQSKLDQLLERMSAKAETASQSALAETYEHQVDQPKPTLRLYNRGRPTVPTRPRRTFSLSLWFVAKVFTVAFEGSYREWTWQFRSQQILPSDAPILIAIKAGEMTMIEHYLETRAVFADDIVQESKPSIYLPSRKDDQCPFLEYVLLYSCRPLDTINLVLKYLNAERNIDLLWSLLSFLATESLHRQISSQRQRILIYKALVERYDLDLELEWPTSFLSDHLMPFMFAERTEYLLPVMDDLVIFSFLHCRSLEIGPKPQLSYEETILRMDPLRQLIEPFKIMLMFNFMGPSTSLCNAPPAVKDWMLHADLARYSDTIRVRRPRLNILRLGASPFHGVHGRSALQTILTASFPHAFVTDLGVRLDDWVNDLQEVGYDIQAYVEAEQEFCSRSQWRIEGPFRRKFCEHELRFRSVEWSESSQSICLSFDVLWRPMVWTRRWNESADTWHKYLPDRILGLPLFDEMREWQLTERRDKECVKFTIKHTHLAERFGYIADTSLPGIQDDHGLVARSAERRRRMLRLSHEGHCKTRSHSQPRSLHQCRWKINTKNKGWLNRCHVCPFEPHRTLHWLGPNLEQAQFDDELISCLRELNNQTARTSWFKHPKRYEDNWFPKIRRYRRDVLNRDDPETSCRVDDFISDGVVRGCYEEDA